MMLWLELFSLPLIVESVLKYEILPDYKVSSFEGTPNSITKLFNSIHTEVDCLLKCSDGLCTAFSYNKETKKCVTNYYSRVLLEMDTGGAVWIKSIYVLIFQTFL